VPAPTRSLTLADIHDHVRRHCFTPAGPTGRVGVELELLTMQAGNPARRPAAADLYSVIDLLDVPGGGALTVEPGGQVELSSRPHAGAAATIEATAAGLTSLQGALAGAGIRTAALGLDPSRG
jgi:glutamate--cysteine ligase